MSKEVVVVTTNKDAASQCGIAVVDLDTGASVISNFKQCVADVNCICFIGGPSSFSGNSSSSSSCGDYIAVAQSSKPVINVYQWNKPQVHYTCHVQEITTCLCADACGTYLISGSHKGWISVWEVGTGSLVSTFQAHSRQINKITVSNCNNYVISGSDEGVVKVYSLLDLVDGGDSLLKIKSRNYTGRSSAPAKHHRSYNAHSLPVRDLVVMGTCGAFRIYSCSTDKTVCMYDVHSGRVFHKMTFPHGLESIAVNMTCDSLFVGSSNGPIYSVDMGLIAIGLSAQHAQKAHLGSLQSIHSSGSGSGDPSSRSLTTLASTTYNGHSRAVSALSVSLDNTLLVSASLDGSLRTWDVISRQCLKDLKIMNKLPLTSCSIRYRHELSELSASTAKPTLVPFEPLRKYAANGEAARLAVPAALVGGGASAGGCGVGGVASRLHSGYNSTWVDAGKDDGALAGGEDLGDVSMPDGPPRASKKTKR